MVDPTPGTEATKVLHSSGTTTPAVTARPFGGGRNKLSGDERWHGYQIDGPAADGGVNLFEATNVGQMEKVLISATLLTKATAARRSVWELLSTQLPPGARIPACVEAQEEEGWRYEVTSQPPPMTLREWIACHQAEVWAQKLVLEQLTITVSALHSLGIVHLRLRPENIYLTGEGPAMELTVGGLEGAVLYKHAGSVASEIDPFYAPPEAADDQPPQPGIGLCAWDWWSVGRIIQEMILGRHVMSMLFGGDVVRGPTAQLRERATALLLETDPPGLRAGAVESMPELDLPRKAMLRGLLTSARDARWGAEDIRLWLAKENVSNHYDLARNARFYTWKGRGRTLVAAAQFFRAEENWVDGEHNLFATDDAATLAYFLSTVPEHAADWKKWQDINGHVASPEWSGVPEDARRTVAAALAWLVFGPQPGALVVKGRRIDAAGLSELLNNGQEVYNYEVVKALISAPCLALIAPIDPAAAETLKLLAALGGEALRKAEQNRWVDSSDPGSLAYVLRLSLEPEPVLRKRADRMRTTFAACQDVGLATMLADKNPTPAVNLLLVITGENPRRFGYITRAEHVREHLTRLQERSRQLSLALFWLLLKQWLLLGRPWSGSWRAFFWFWLGVVAFGVVIAHDVPSTTGFALALLGLRLLLGRRIRRLALRSDPAASPWSWRDGPDRCDGEAQRTLAETEFKSESQERLAKQFEETRAAILALKADDNRALVSLPKLTGLWPVFLAAAVVCAVGSVQLLKDFGQNIDSETFSLAWQKPALEATPRDALRIGPETPAEIAAALSTIPGLAPEMIERVKRGEYELVKEPFGFALDGPIKPWNMPLPAVVPPLPVQSRVAATAAQRAFALVSGELLLRPYGRKGVTALFVVRVPIKDGFGVMVYNAKARRLIDNTALVLSRGLPDETWYKLGRSNVIYLGSPTQVDVDRGRVLTRIETAQPVALPY